MLEYGKDLHFDLVLPRLKLVSAKQVLIEFVQHAARHQKISEHLLFEQLSKRENESGSGIGDGIAIPHLQIQGPQTSFTILATMAREIDDFKSTDDAPVNLAAFVLSPESDGPLHLRRLSRISRMLKNETMHKRLIEAQDELAIRSVLIDPEGWMLAA
jgi:PTS system nitrogen regulatory IIA component